MDDKYMVDLRHLVDLNKTTVYIEVSSCFEYKYPTEGMNILCHLLRYVQKHINERLFENIDASAFNNLVKKVEDNKNYLYELDRYIEFTNKKLKKDKGWDEDDCASVGLPKQSFEITIEELIAFYKSLELLEECYDKVKEEIIIAQSISNYLKDIEAIKGMLEKRLAYAIINKR